MRQKIFLLLALLAAVAQGMWAQASYISLWDTGSNSSTITSNNGTTGNVAIIGRTLYRDGDWNTLCLPFNMDSYQIAESPLAGTTIKELDGTNSNLSDNTLTLKFNTATEIVAGRPYIVKWPVVLTISDADDWVTFATNVASGTTYAGQIVKLAADVEVTAGTMVGTSSANAFQGVFDGGGHTITCNITNEGSSSTEYKAPFRYIHNATIMYVKVVGSVTGPNHCAGLVGFATGTNAIKNCEVTADVTCTNTHCGGILGHGQSSTTTIWNCLYAGTIKGTGTTNVGVIYGWSNSDGKHTINNCLANGTYNATGTVDMIRGNGTLTASYCYQNIALEGKKGTYFSSYSASDLVTNLGQYDWEVVSEKAVPKMAVGSGNLTSPVFNQVTIADVTNDVSFSGGAFKGNYDALTINDANRNSILLLTSGSKLGYVKSGVTRTLNPFRAYFELPASTPAHNFVLDFGDETTTGIIEVKGVKEVLTPEGMSVARNSDNSYYSLDGRRLNGKPTTKGLYIFNGRKVVIK